MAENKKKIVVYADWIDNFEELTDLELGILFRHFFDYVNDKNPVLKDRLIKVAWKPIEATLRRDLKKWEQKAPERTNKARVAGLASAEKRRQLKATKSNSLVESELNPTKSTVSDSVSVSVNDKVSVTKSINSRETEFKNSLQPHLAEFGSDLLNEFYLYWTEKKPKGRKMLFEMQKTFDIKRRLDRWSLNDYGKKEKSIAPKKEKKSAAEIIQKELGIN